MIRLVFFLLVLSFPQIAKSAEVAVALTEDIVEVNTSFAGARVVLFGAIDGEVLSIDQFDIISVVRGPASVFEVRKLERKNYVWMPGEAAIIAGAPGLYLTGSTRPINDVVPLPEQSAHHLGIDTINFDITNAAVLNQPKTYRAAFLDELEFLGLYKNIVGNVEYQKGRLFRIDIDLPARTPIGEYEVAVYLFQNGALFDRDSAILNVNKVGLERRIFELAHNRPISYGVVCVAISLLAGWAAGAVFRK